MSTQVQGDTPGFQLEQVVGVYEHLAATATESAVVFEARRACRLRYVGIRPQRAVTGVDTNTTHLNIKDEATEIGNYDLTSGNNLTAGQKKDIVTTDRMLAAGQRIFLEWEKIGTGLLVPPMTVLVEFDFEPAV